MKTIITILIGSLLLLIGLSFVGKNSGEHNGKCTGSASCSACSNCSRCGHCSAGGTCGVCRGSSSGRSFYSSGSSSKKKTLAKKKSTNSSNITTDTNSRYGFYSNSSDAKGKTPVYDDEHTSLSEENFLYVNGNSINVRKGPGENYPVLEKVNKNQKLVFVSEEEEGWLKIIVYSTGTEGYVYRKFVR